MNYIFLIHSWAGGQLDDIHFMTILEGAAKNMETQMSPLTYGSHFL